MKRVLLTTTRLVPAILALAAASTPSMAGYRGGASGGFAPHAMAAPHGGGFGMGARPSYGFNRPTYLTAGAGFHAPRATWRPSYQRPAYNYGYGRRHYSRYGFGAGVGAAVGYGAGYALGSSYAGDGYGAASGGYGYGRSYPSTDAAYAPPANIASPCCGSQSYAYPATTSYVVPETTEQTFYRTRRVEVLNHYYVTTAYTRPVTTYRAVQQYVAPVATTHVCGCEQ